MKRKICSLLILCPILLSSCSSFAPDNSGDTKSTSVQDMHQHEKTETGVESREDEEAVLHDNVPELKYDGATFDIITREVGYMNYAMNADEITGEPLNDAIYNRNRGLESRFDIAITEVFGKDSTSLTAVTAGDTTYEMIKNRGPMAITFFQSNLLYLITDVPYIDLNQPYWDHNINKALTIGGKQFIVSGALSVTEYDYTSALLYNKQLLNDLQLSAPYALVNSGSWTYDAMNEMMTTAVADTNGDGAFTSEDRYGYLATPKHVLPSFIIAAGELSVTKNEEDIPSLSMEHERYIDVFNKVFEITIDNGAWFKNSSGDNVGKEAITMFSENKALFMDSVMFYLDQLREMENDFGVLPYPKYNTEQEDYVSRCSWVEPFIVPVTNTQLEMTGAVIEAMCCESANSVIPAYYEISLKGKISRDEASREMLDLIFSHRVIDFGDTIWVDVVRDGVLSSMYSSENRNLSSKIKMMNRLIAGKLDKLKDVIPSLNQED